MSKLLAELNNPFNACAHKQQCIDRIAELEAGNLCTVCTGNPISPYPCICGGSGTVQDEAQGLRELVVELEQKLKIAKAEQREVDAVLVESNNVLLNYAICQSVVKMLAETIREQEIE